LYPLSYNFPVELLFGYFLGQVNPFQNWRNGNCSEAFNLTLPITKIMEVILMDQTCARTLNSAAPHGILLGIAGMKKN